MNPRPDFRPAALALLERLATLGAHPTGIADDSRRIGQGALFLAYPGDHADGRDYVREAIAQGASAVLWQDAGSPRALPADLSVPALAVDALRPLAGALAEAVHGFPSERLPLIAVTGTNGKTTVSQCIARAWPRPCAVIGTLGAGFPAALADTGFTTPGACALAGLLERFANDGALACALEASSIGIAEGRLDGCRIDTAIFTNFTRDHLDYHGSMAAYAAAKTALFHWPQLRLAIINLDDPLGPTLARQTTAARLIGTTLSDARQEIPTIVRASAVELKDTGLSFLLHLPNGKARVRSRLLGDFNVSNLLAVAAVLYDAGLQPEEIARRLAQLEAPPGRLQQVGKTSDDDLDEPLIVVDYAHTPDALDKALRTLRPLASERGGKLRVLFGCGGNRDPGKRRLMGEVAARLADSVLLTSDNPRSEDPLAILAAIHAGAPKANCMPDRRAAIRTLVAAASPADVLLLAGKGHETTQEIAGVRQHFSDAEEAAAALCLRKDNPS